MPGRVPALVAALAPLGLVAAGCGGAKPPSVASIATATTPPGAVGNATSAKPSRAALAACLTAHGFSAAVGSAHGAGGAVLDLAGVIVAGNVDPASSQFQAAMRACRRFMPGGGPPELTPSQQAVAARAMLRFAKCMRAHGVPSFPDPSSDGRFSPESLAGIDPSSPFLTSAFKACASLEPTVGPRLALP